MNTKINSLLEEIEAQEQSIAIAHEHLKEAIAFKEYLESQLPKNTLFNKTITDLASMSAFTDTTNYDYDSKGFHLKHDYELHIEDIYRDQRDKSQTNDQSVRFTLYTQDHNIIFRTIAETQDEINRAITTASNIYKKDLK